MSKGWISLHRSLQDHWLWEEKPFSKGQAWIDLLMLANHEDHKKRYKGDIITCKRGEVDRSILWLAERWGWGRHKARDFLTLLEKDEMITINATTNRTTITIENYDRFQDCGATVGTTDEPTSGQRADNEGATSGQRADTYNNTNNANNDNNDNNETNTMDVIAVRNIIPPTFEMVSEYIAEHNYSIDPSEFISWHDKRNWMLNGEPVRDWQAVLDAWERRVRNKSTTKKGRYDWIDDI